MVTERASEMAKLIGCSQPAEPGKHSKNRSNQIHTYLVPNSYLFNRIHTEFLLSLVIYTELTEFTEFTELGVSSVK